MNERTSVGRRAFEDLMIYAVMWVAVGGLLRLGWLMVTHWVG